MNKLASIILLVVVIFAAATTFVNAQPRTRAIKNQRRSYGEIENSIMNEKRICERNMACGWILYRQDYPTQNFRQIRRRKNTYCECAPDTECVLKENRHQMGAYVFYCRGSDENQDLLRFPDSS